MAIGEKGMDINKECFGYTPEEIEKNRIEALSWKDSNRPKSAVEDQDVDNDAFHKTLLEGIELLIEDKKGP